MSPNRTVPLDLPELDLRGEQLSVPTLSAIARAIELNGAVLIVNGQIGEPTISEWLDLVADRLKTRKPPKSGHETGT